MPGRAAHIILCNFFMLKTGAMVRAVCRFRSVVDRTLDLLPQYVP